MGFSLHLWSERLSSFCAKKIKEFSNKTVIVAGGPSVDDIDSALIKFMQDNPYYDVSVPNEGEISFVRLIEHLKRYGKITFDKIIEGCAIITPEGKLLRGNYLPPELPEIPSPYLEGLLDSFIEQGYNPVIQTMRGCPYSCKFCVSGTAAWSKIRAFDLKRVFDEFNYIKKRTKSDYLILTDENFGLLKDRDLKIAKHIANSYIEGRYPHRLYYYSAKIITEHVLKIAEIFSPFGEIGFSFQTLNESVKKEIKRTNITYEQFLKYIKWASKKKIMTSTEMIFGFPGETVESYIAGIEQLMRSGVDRIYSYNLRLFNGIDLATQENRDKYKLKTMYRLPERTYSYLEGDVITEVEEVVVASYSFDFSDYLKIRQYGLFLELIYGRGYLSGLIRLMINLGMPGEKLVAFLAENDFLKYPKLHLIVSEYEKRAKNELSESRDDCAKFVQGLALKNSPIPEVKLNLIYTGKIMLDSQARTELFALVKDFVKIYGKDELIDFFADYTDNFLLKQIVSFRQDEEFSVGISSRICLDKIEKNKYTSVKDLLSEEPISFNLTLHRDAAAFIRNKPLRSINDEETLQDIYMTLCRFGLLRIRK